MNKKLFIIIVFTAFVAVCSIIVMCSNASDKEVVVYAPETWEGVADFTSDNLYVPYYGESGMDIRDNINTNFDKITIAIQDLNRRLEAVEE